MLSRHLRNHRRSIVGMLAAVALLLTMALPAVAQTSTSEPTAYRDCWLGSPSHYDDCVQANTWGAGTDAAGQSASPDAVDASLVIDGIPSY